MFSFLSRPEKVDCAYPKITETIPSSKLGYHTNNVYAGFPPLMSDGRVVTAAYQPEAVLNSYLLEETGLQNNWEYRRYLQKNALDIMKFNMKESCNDVGYMYRFQDLTTNYSTPTTVPSFLDDSSELKGYQNSDLKQLYLSREQLEAKMVAPQITQAELLKNEKMMR